MRCVCKIDQQLPRLGFSIMDILVEIVNAPSFASSRTNQQHIIYEDNVTDHFIVCDI